MSREGHCLLVKTVDNRHFFTELENFPQLIEFSKAQNAEVSVVKPQEEIRVLALPELAKSFCDPTYKMIDPKYELIERRIGVISAGKTPRQRLLAQAQEIRAYIESMVMAGESVSLQKIGEKFTAYNLGEAAIRKHLTFVRLKLAKIGHAVSKVGVGTYKLHKE
jgi:hypothetical protein